jgi:hypothetical protein
MSNLFKKSVIFLVTLFLVSSCANGNKGVKNGNMPTTQEKTKNIGTKSSSSNEQSPPNDSERDALNKDKDTVSDSSSPQNENAPTTHEQQATDNLPSDEQSPPNDSNKDALSKDEVNTSDSSTPQNENTPTTPEQQENENSSSNEQSSPNNPGKDALNKGEGNAKDSSAPHNDGVPTAPKKLEVKKAENSLGNTQPNINEQSTIKNLDKMSNKKKTKPTKKWNMQRRTVKKKKDEN